MQPCECTRLRLAQRSPKTAPRCNLMPGRTAYETRLRNSLLQHCAEGSPQRTRSLRLRATKRAQSRRAESSARCASTSPCQRSRLGASTQGKG